VSHYRRTLYINMLASRTMPTDAWFTHTSMSAMLPSKP